jgi:hypothetical protein
MTTEPPSTPEPEATVPPIPAAPATTAPTVSGQMLLLVGAVLIVGEYLIFGLIANEWYPGEVSLVAATVILAMALLKGGETRSVLRVGGYVIGAAGVWNFLEGIRFGWDGFVDVIAWIILALAAVLAFIGARTLD